MTITEFIDKAIKAKEVYGDLNITLNGTKPILMFSLNPYEHFCLSEYEPNKEDYDNN